MAQTPKRDDLPEVTLRNTREVVAYEPTPIHRAKAELGETVRDVAHKIADQQNQLALTRADTETAVELDAIAERYRTDDDWTTAPARAKQEAAEVLNARTKTLRGAQTRRVWAERVQERLGRFETGMRAQSRQRGAELTRADLVRLGETSEEIAGDLQRTEDVRRLAARNYAEAIQAAEDAGFIAADDAARLETVFADRVRGRVREGLRAEIATRIDLDPDELAEELNDPQGPFAQLPPDERVRHAAQAHRAGAAFAIDEALEHTLRTGEVIGEDDPRLADRWAHLGDRARFSYASRAADMAAMHTMARSMGELSGLSLTEIATRADQAQRSQESSAAKALLRMVGRDPAAYTISTQPNVDLLRQQMRAAYAAAQAAPDDPEAQAALTRARRAYATETVRAQEAIGLPGTQARIYTQAETGAWARRVRALPLEQQQRAIDSLPSQMLRMYGDEALAERGVQEHLESFYADQAGRTAPEPDRAAAAANGYDEDQVRAQISAQINAGASVDDPLVRTLLSRLPEAQRQRTIDELRQAEQQRGQ